MPNSGDARLVLDRATKSFGAVQALADGSISLYAGEAHALLGENGAGKSTLVKILGGVHHADTGELLIDGTARVFSGPAASRDAGISIIFQEPSLFPDLSVAENIFMGRQPLAGGRRIDRRTMERRAAAIFADLGVALDPARPARGLSVADQQLVEIAKALSLNSTVMVMDEPTARPHRGRGRTALRRGSPRCASRAPPCCSSRTGSKRSSPAANASRSCATAGSSERPRSRT